MIKKGNGFGSEFLVLYCLIGVFFFSWVVVLFSGFVNAVILNPEELITSNNLNHPVLSNLSSESGYLVDSHIPIISFNSGYSNISPIDFMNEETSPFAEGYIIEFEDKPIAVKTAELEKAAEKNTGKFFQNLPLFRNAYTTTYSLDSKISSYEGDFDSARQNVKDKIFNKRSLITGNAISDTNSEEVVMEDYRLIFNGIALNISEDEAKEIEKIDGVKSVSKNMRVEILLSDSVPLIQDGILAGRLDGNGDDCTVSGEECLTGENVTIAIIDTGIDYTHEDLGGCTSEQFLSGNCAKVISGYDFINNDANPMDDHGHGTHCAGIAAGNGVLKGVAPDAKLLSYKVLDSSGSGSFAGVIAGIEQAVLDGADVLSLSLGGDGNPDDPQSQAVDNAVLAGKVVVVAAGNAGPYEETIGSPGTARKAITVGATDKYDALAVFSSRGPVIWTNNSGKKVMVKPDVLVPGVSICSAQSSTDPWNDRLCLDNNHVAISGTSMATPHVAGVVALLKQKHSNWTPEEIKGSIKATAIDLNLLSTEQGAGRVNVSKLIKLNESQDFVYFYSSIDYPSKDQIFRLGNKEVIEFGGPFQENYDSLTVEYQKEGETEWRTSGMDVIGTNEIIAKFDSSVLNERGKYIFNISFGFKGKNFITTLPLIFLEQTQEPLEISNCEELQNMGSESGVTYFALSYVLTNDIDCSDTKNWNGGEGFRPIIPFDEQKYNLIYSFDGKGFFIENLYINRPYETGVGLFTGVIIPSISSWDPINDIEHLSNLKLLNVHIVGRDYVGGLVGAHFRGSIKNVQVTGFLEGTRFYAGGLVATFGGFTEPMGEISNSSTNVNLFGDMNVGGLVGVSGFVKSRGGSISNSYSEGTVSGRYQVGGLIGYMGGGSVVDSYSIVDRVSGSYQIVGGLIGACTGGVVNETFFEGIVFGPQYVGGLVGVFNGNEEKTRIISNSYAKGSVIGNGASECRAGDLIEECFGGGFVGYSMWGVFINSYASNYLSNFTKMGGLFGEVIGGPNFQFVNSYWDTQVSNTTTMCGETYYFECMDTNGKTTEEMKNILTFNNWNIITTYVDLNNGYPYLSWQIGNDNSVWLIPGPVYNITNCKELQSMKSDLSGDYQLMNNIDCSETKNWNCDVSGDNCEGFEPIGDAYNAFVGSFEGNKFKISELHISRSSTNNVGLFGHTSNVSISNIGLVDVHIIGSTKVGGLAGGVSMGNITNSFSSGNISGFNEVGGLVGSTYYGSQIFNSYSEGSVYGFLTVGGLTGISFGEILNSYSDSEVISNSLQGEYVGGFVGRNYGLIENSYFSGIVFGGNVSGGFTSVNEQILYPGTINDSFWDINNSGLSESAGGIGKTTSEMKNISTYDTWNISYGDEDLNNGYPYLAWQNNELGVWLIHDPLLGLEECTEFDGFVFSLGNFFYDSCKNESTLIENYCGINIFRWDVWNINEKIAKQKEIDCEFGCFNGACVENPEECVIDDDCLVDEICVEGICINENDLPEEPSMPRGNI